MEEKKNIHIGAAMNYGLIMGLGLILFTFLTKTANNGDPLNSTITFIGFLTILFYIFGIYYFTKRFRTRHLNGFMTYGMGLKFGILIILFASIILGFYKYIDSVFIDPELFERTIKEQKDMVAQLYYKMGVSESTIEEALKTYDESSNTPALLAFSTILNNVFWGFIISLVTAGMLKKQPNPFEQSTNNNSETNK